MQYAYLLDLVLCALYIVFFTKCIILYYTDEIGTYIKILCLASNLAIVSSSLFDLNIVDYDYTTLDLF